MDSVSAYGMRAMNASVAVIDHAPIVNHGDDLPRLVVSRVSDHGAATDAFAYGELNRCLQRRRSTNELAVDDHTEHQQTPELDFVVALHHSSSSLVHWPLSAFQM